MLHRRSSNSSLPSSRKLSENKNIRQWTTLFSGLIDLNERNYTKSGKDCILKLHSVVHSDVINASKVASTTVLCLLYERSLQELLLRTFPVSASLINTLTEKSIDIYNVIQPIMQEQLEQLQNKLRGLSKISGIDVGVTFLLISISRLDKLAGRDPPTALLKQIIKDTNDYVELVSLEKSISNDAFVALIFSLIWYASSFELKDVDISILMEKLRKGYITCQMTKFGKALALNAIERNVDDNIKLYVTHFKKIMAQQRFLLSGIEDHIAKTSFPMDSFSDGMMDGLSDSMSILKTQESMEADEDVFTCESPSLVKRHSSSSTVATKRMEPEGSSGSDEDNCNKLLQKVPDSRSSSQSSSSISSLEEASERSGKWARSISEEAKQIGER